VLLRPSPSIETMDPVSHEPGSDVVGCTGEEAQSNCLYCANSSQFCIQSREEIINILEESIRDERADGKND
jgi:hypothetical protein